MFSTIKKLEKENEIAKDKNRRLKSIIDEKEDHITNLQREARREKRKSQELEEIAREDLSKAENRIKTLIGIVGYEEELALREIEIVHREGIVTAQEVNAENFKEKMNDLKVKTEQEGEKRYNSGYADGIADGLRKAHEITAEDRRNSMQIAALAAASHQPDATKQIAAAIAKDVTRALPYGKSK